MCKKWYIIYIDIGFHSEAMYIVSSNMHPTNESPPGQKTFGSINENFTYIARSGKNASTGGIIGGLTLYVINADTIAFA